MNFYNYFKQMLIAGISFLLFLPGLIFQNCKQSRGDHSVADIPATSASLDSTARPACVCNKEGQGNLFFNEKYVTWSDDSVYHFVKKRPFRFSDYKDKFRIGKLKEYDISKVHFNIDSLQPLTLKDYYTIFQEQPQKTAEKRDWYYFFSVQDTTNYYALTILFYRDETYYDLYLVHLTSDGKKIDNGGGVSTYSYKGEGKPYGFSRTTTKKLPGYADVQEQSTHSEYWLPNAGYDKSSRPGPDNLAGTYTYYDIKTIVASNGEMCQVEYKESHEPATKYRPLKGFVFRQ